MKKKRDCSDITSNMLHNYFLGLFLEYFTGHNFLLPVGSPFSAAVQNLLECSQFQLALQLTVCAFSSCLQHGISNTMGLALSEKVTFSKFRAALQGFGRQGKGSHHALFY